MNFFGLTDHFQIVPGEAPIVLGAPHHGTRPNVDADRGTGPIALALAAKLKSRAVIVSDLRRTVDVNKNPAGLAKSVQGHAIRYQNEMFKCFPQLVIEIHGHVSGQYPLEVATGFDLEEGAPGDAIFLERLRFLKANLATAPSGRMGRDYPVGVSPLDRDVKKTATNPFTFQKIRRARNLAGLECYGLHIELAAELRTSLQARKASYIDALAEALASCIKAAFEPLPAAGATIPLRTDASDDDPATGACFEAAQAPEKYLEQSVALLHPDELGALGALDGDALILYNHGESVRVEVLSSIMVRRGQVALPARVRRQVNVALRQKITLSLPAARRSRPVQNAAGTMIPGLVVARARSVKNAHVWLAPDEMARFGIQPQALVSLKGHNSLPASLIATLQPDDGVKPRMVELSKMLMDKMSLTVGEVVRLEAVQ